VHRFFAPDADPGDASVALPRAEAEHLTRVLRLGTGDLVAVFDGRGREYLGRVLTAGARDARVVIVRPLDAAVESSVAVTLVQAVLKGDKMDEVVRDSVMLGVTAIQPIVTRRTETTVAALMRAGRVDRWQRVALASVKQSGRAVLPDVRPPLPFDASLDEPGHEMSLMLVEPGAHAPAMSLGPLQAARRPVDAAVFVGPEGGWHEEEWRAAHARGVRLVTLGRRTLRADAVAIAALSVLDFIWGGVTASGEPAT
jgi:16S rRNA (uracil1498-N3)-methyltransferase